jgi:hypothetical protein
MNEDQMDALGGRISQEVTMAVSMIQTKATYTPVPTVGRVELNWIPRAIAAPTRVPDYRLAMSSQYSKDETTYLEETPEQGE